MKRCFLALRLADATLSALASLQRELVALPQPEASIRLLPTVSLHVTLRFLGNTNDAQLRALEKGLEDLVAHTPPCAAMVSGVGTFPDERRPHTVFAGVHSSHDSVESLAHSLEEACRALDFPPESRPYVPHVTVARLSHVVPQGGIIRWLQSQLPRAFGQVDGTTVMLFESISKAGGSIYTPIASFPLVGGRE